MISPLLLLVSEVGRLPDKVLFFPEEEETITDMHVKLRGGIMTRKYQICLRLGNVLIFSGESSGSYIHLGKQLIF